MQGIVDLVKMKALIWSGEELGAKFDEVDIPADMQELADEYREKLIDAVVELDDAVSVSIDLLLAIRPSHSCLCTGGS